MADPRHVYMVLDQQETEHEQPWQSYHIETPERLRRIIRRLQDSRLVNDPRVVLIPQREATRDELRMVHTERYISDIESTQFMNSRKAEEFCRQYEDIYVNKCTFERAKLAAGSAIDVTTTVLEKAKLGWPVSGIAFVRPPGHHAMPDAGCGFCIFNNVMIAALAAIRSNLAKRVLIVDFDVHAANGTEECIKACGEDIQLISIHRYEDGKFWPNLKQSGLYESYPTTLNVPLPAKGYGDAEYHTIFTHVVLPFCYHYRPDVIMVSCGFDAAKGDPEGEMDVTPAAFGNLMRLLLSTGIPVSAVLEGGYFLSSLALGSEMVVRAMLGDEMPLYVTQLPHPVKEPLVRPDIMKTIYMVWYLRRQSVPFFKKLLELREKLHGELNLFAYPATDYHGERTVSAPYQTRGVYKERKSTIVENFETELRHVVKDYRVVTPLNRRLPPEEMHRELPGFVGICEAGEVVVGCLAARILVSLVIQAPLDSRWVPPPVPKHVLDFSRIEFDEDTIERLLTMQYLAYLPITHP